MNISICNKLLCQGCAVGCWTKVLLKLYTA